MKTYLYRASPLFHSGNQFLVSAKNCRFLQFIRTNTTIVIINIFFIWVFSECTEAIAISLIPLVTNFLRFVLL